MTSFGDRPLSHEAKLYNNFAGGEVKVARLAGTPELFWRLRCHLTATSMPRTDRFVPARAPEPCSAPTSTRCLSS